MTGKERMLRILRHEPVDRIGVYEHFWGDTYNAWRAEGHIPNGESFDDHFGYDMSECWAFNVVADPVVGYFYKTYVLGVPQDAAATWAKIGAVTTLVNAIVAVAAASVFYLALRPALERAGLIKPAV